MGRSRGVPRQTPRPLPWLDRNWPFVGTAVLCFLVALLPLLVRTWPRPPLIVCLLLAAYQFHQIEEHYGDRFRRYVNEAVLGGVNALTPRATMWANVGGVWGGYLATLLLTVLVDPGFGLVAAYTTVINAGAHTVGAIVTRSYNPGLLTALVLFVPLGGWAVIALREASTLGSPGHASGSPLPFSATR